MADAGLTILFVLGFSLIDIITGILSALKNKNLKSGSLRDGIFKKFGYLLLMVMCFLIDEGGQYVGLTLSVELLPIVVIYLVITEVTSILENLCEMIPGLKSLNLTQYLDVNNIASKEDEDE